MKLRWCLLLAAANSALPFPAQANEPAISAAVAAVDNAAPFIPATFNPPTLVETARFKIVPLGPALVDRDFKAYMSSIEHLQTTFSHNTKWPRADITRADALNDMQNEQARFDRRSSFAYAVLSPDGREEMGSVYVSPSRIAGYDAVVRLWVTKDRYAAGFDQELYAWVTGWMEAAWPFKSVAYPGRAIDWQIWDGLNTRHQPAP